MRRGLALLALGLIGAGQPPDAIDARVFDKVWADVDRLYWDPALHGLDWRGLRDRFRPQALAAPDAEALYRVINRMLDLLHDSHVFAIPPAEARYQRSLDKGDEHPGFGFASWLQGEDWRVYAVTPGTSAALAGVRPGWRLVSIDGQPVDIDRHPAVDERARLVFADLDGRARVLELTAAEARPPPTVRSRRLPGGVLLIMLDGFEAHEDRRLAELLHADPPPAAVILDLRDNDGGEEETAARAAGLFFAGKHPLLLRRDRRREETVPIEGAGRRSWLGPLAVLVGSRSASAAEALAALLGETGRAQIVGERTAGALTGASLDPLPDGGRLSIAQFDVRTPGGERIEGRGYVPGHVVPLTLRDMAAGRDPQLAAALALVKPAAPSLSLRDTLHARP